MKVGGANPPTKQDNKNACHCQYMKGAKIMEIVIDIALVILNVAIIVLLVRRK